MSLGGGVQFSWSHKMKVMCINYIKEVKSELVPSLYIPIDKNKFISYVLFLFARRTSLKLHFLFSIISYSAFNILVQQPVSNYIFQVVILILPLSESLSELVKIFSLQFYLDPEVKSVSRKPCPWDFK